MNIIIYYEFIEESLYVIYLLKYVFYFKKTIYLCLIHIIKQ